MVTGLEMRGHLDYLERVLPQNRFYHSLRVARTAASLARHYDCLPWKAWLAGIYHDLAREWSPQKLKSGAEARGRINSPREDANPLLLHGWMGAQLLKEEREIEDPEILEGVEYHVLGGEALSSLAQIIYIADFLEPGRSYHRSSFRQLHQGRSLRELYRWVEQNVQSYYK